MIKAKKPRPAYVQVLSSALPFGPKLVAVALVSHCNPKHQCYPSVATLARESSLSVRAVQRHLRTLEKLGFITIETRPPKGASQYHIHLNCLSEVPKRDRNCDKLSPQGVRIGTSYIEQAQVEQAQPQKNIGSTFRLHRSPPPQGPGVNSSFDDGPDKSNLFAETPVVTKGKIRQAKPIETWSNTDVANEFESQASRYYPMRSNRTHLPALVRGLKSDREKTGHTAALHVSMIDAFFGPMHKRQITDTHPLWIQFLASLDRLTARAEETLDWTRKRRQSNGAYDVPEPEPRNDDEKVQALLELYGQQDLKWTF